MTKNELKEMLKTQIVEVVFEKVDGTLRTLEGTLCADIIPPATKDDTLSQKKVRKISEEVCVVWDAANQDWRSFRWDRLKRVNGSEFVHGA